MSRMRNVLSFIAAVGLAAGAQAALGSGAAQDSGYGNSSGAGHSAKATPHAPDPRESGKMAMSVASCLVSKAGKAADAMVGGPMSADPNYDALVKALTNRKYDHCVKREEAGLPMNQVNGALAESLVKAAHPALPDRASGINAGTVSSFFSDPGGKTIDSVARCLAVYSPGLAAKVLGTEQGSAAETGALAELYAKSPECGMKAAPDGFSALEQRDALAVGLYHWLHHG